MNRKTELCIKRIVGAKATYDAEVVDCLTEYREEKQKITQKAAAYKDEKGFIASQIPTVQAKARSRLSQAENTFRKELKESVAGLKAELMTSISAPIPPEFTERISFYRQTGITPSRTETRALIEMGRKSPIAIAAVSKLLTDSGAEFTVKYRSIGEYERDLQNLEDLTEMPLVCSPYSVHSELVDVMRGQTKATRTAAGWRNVGFTWEGSIDLMMQSTAVETRLKALENAADAWEADVTYQFAEDVDKKFIKAQKEDAESKGQTYTAEVPESSVSIKEEDNGVKLAREIGRESANTGSILRTKAKTL